MKFLFAAAACASALAAPVALAQGTLDLLYVPQTEFGIEVSDPSIGSVSDDVDGDGFGVRGMGRAGERAAVRAEYQSVTYKDDNGPGEADIDQLRFGLGVIGASTSGVFAEYNKIDIEDSKLDGYALHGRVAGNPSPEAQFYADVGWARLEDENGSDWRGPEFSVGAAVGLSPAFAVLFDYRVTRLEASEDTTTVEFEFTDLRVGGRLMFGSEQGPPKPRKKARRKAG